MSDIPPSGYPKPSDGPPYDSEAPTQLWQSPFRHLSQFPNRRAARRRERLEALLKGEDVTSTAMLSSTNLTETATSAANASAASSSSDVSPFTPPAGLPDVPPPPESIPTGTYTSIRPVSGPRLAIFVALGVAAGGLAALQLNRVLTPIEGATPNSVTASVAPPAARTDEAKAAVAQAPEPIPAFEVDMPEACAPDAEKAPAVPPLQVEVVSVRATSPLAKPGKSTAHASAPGPVTNDTPVDVSSALVNPEPTSQTSCSRYSSVQIPTQLHPRINPLMTSNQVFAEERSQASTRRGSH